MSKEPTGNKSQLFPRQNVIDVKQVTSGSNFWMSVENLSWIWKLDSTYRDDWEIQEVINKVEKVIKKNEEKNYLSTAAKHKDTASGSGNLWAAGHMENIQREALPCVPSVPLIFDLSQ